MRCRDGRFARLGVASSRGRGEVDSAGIAGTSRGPGGRVTGGVEAGAEALARAAGLPVGGTVLGAGSLATGSSSLLPGRGWSPGS